MNNGKLLVHAILDFIGDHGITFFDAGFTQMLKIIPGRIKAFGQLKMRQMGAFKVKAYMAALADGVGISQSFWTIGEKGRHFLGGLDVKLIIGKAHAVGIRNK